ncbi:MAG: class I SAM-dependent methyltransferase [Bryobacterales bacterium]
MDSTGAVHQSASPYQFKPGPYSSHSLLLEHFPPPGEGRRVLDVGGGEGFLSRILKERGYQVVCLAAPGSVAAAFPEGVEVREADLDLDQPQFSAPFSFIVCGDVLEHLRAPQTTLRWLGEQLAPGGQLVASLPNSGHWYFRLTVLSGRFPADDRGLFDRTHLHFYTWDGWRELFQAAGLDITSAAPTTVPFGLAWGAGSSHIAVRALERLSYELGRLWKTMFAYQLVVLARPGGK